MGVLHERQEVNKYQPHLSGGQHNPGRFIDPSKGFVIPDKVQETTLKKTDVKKRSNDERTQ